MFKQLATFLVLSIFITLVFQTAHTVQAQDPNSPSKYTAKSMINSMDKNGDGKISKKEAPAELKKSFGYVDTNNDGSIDVNEAKAMADHANNEKSAANKPAGAKLKTTKGVTAKQFIVALDKDGNGKVSKSETFGQIKTNFTYMDSNGDGFIDTQEAQASLDYAKNNDLVFDLTPTASQLSTSKSKTAAEPISATPQQTIANLDKNGDGKITRREASEDLRLFFGNYDTNKDGSIDEKESASLIAYLKASEIGSTGSPAEKLVRKTPKATAKSVMGQMDLDSDGKITKAEAPDTLKENFAYVDTNNDGVIDINEARSIADFINKQSK
ncbi:MAG: hypothetical protein AB8B55_11295 [Mariniblastus sp.]